MNTQKVERIAEVKVLESNKLILKLEGNGNQIYQHVYREAAGVYWDNDEKGFTSTELKKDWSISDWVIHLLIVVNSIGIELKIDNKTTWGTINEREVKKCRKYISSKRI